MSQVGIIVGSRSDIEVAQRAAAVLGELEVDSEIRVISAHRAPDLLGRFVGGAADRGIGVFIAIAGLAAHLPGVVASQTTLPVIGVAMPGGVADGLDALLAIVQMPKGVPVAAVGRRQRRERGAARGPDPGGRRSGAARAARGATGRPGAGDRGRPGERGALTFAVGIPVGAAHRGSSPHKGSAAPPASRAHARVRPRALIAAPGCAATARKSPPQGDRFRWDRKGERNSASKPAGGANSTLERARSTRNSGPRRRRGPGFRWERSSRRLGDGPAGRPTYTRPRWTTNAGNQACPCSSARRSALSPEPPQVRSARPPSRPVSPASRPAPSPRRSRRRSRSTTSCCRCLCSSSARSRSRPSSSGRRWTARSSSSASRSPRRC